MFSPTQRSGGAATPIWMEVFPSVASALVAQIESRIRTANAVEEQGQTMAEYAVVLAVITPLVVAILSLLGSNISIEIGRVASYINF